MIGNILKLSGMALVAGMGAVVGGWITNDANPVQFLSRKTLTPVVQPGTPFKAELENYRIARCPQKVWRVIHKPDGERTTQTEEKPAEFGKLGLDRYIASVDTPPDAPFGEAVLYTYVARMCNPWEWAYPVVYAEFYDKFRFGPETVRISPDKAPNTLDKYPK